MVLSALQAEWFFSKAQKLAHLGELEESLRHYDRAISKHPRYAGVYLHKAVALGKLNRFSEALNALETAKKLQPANFAHDLFAGILCLDHEKNDEALQSFNKVLEMAPHNKLAWCYRQLIHSRTGRTTVTDQETWLKFIDYTNSDFQSRFLLFCETFLLSHKEDVRSLEGQLFSRNWMDNDRLKKKPRVTLLSKIHEFASLCRYFYSAPKKKALRAFFKGEQHLAKGLLNEAVADYETALKYYHSNLDVQDRLIDIYFYRKEYPLVLKCLERFYGYKHVQEQSVADLIATGNPPGSLPDHPALLFNLALYLYHTSAYTEALALFNFISVHYSDHYFNLYYLGLCYLVQGDADRALDAFKKTVKKINPQVAKHRLEEMFRFSE